MKRMANVLAGAVLSLWTLAGQAHHSTAGYDAEQTVTVTGVVKAFHWTNPHVFVYVLVKNDKGDDVEWSFEGGTPNINIRNGWKSNDIKPGDRITVAFHPARDGRPDGQAAIITLANGEQRFSPGYNASGSKP